jgi:hypothetical protein
LTDISCSAKPAKLAVHLLRSLSSAERVINSTFADEKYL